MEHPSRSPLSPPSYNPSSDSPPSSPPPHDDPHGRRPRGPPPFVLQLLRAPLTLNSLVALAMTFSAIGHRPHRAWNNGGCAGHATAFHALGFLFLASALTNVISIHRFKKIMKRRRQMWRQGLTEEEIHQTVKPRRGPPLVLSVLDLFLASGFLSMFIWTTIIARKAGVVSLSAAYSNIGALVAFIMHFFIGVHAIKLRAMMKNKKCQGGFRKRLCRRFRSRCQDQAAATAPTAANEEGMTETDVLVEKQQPLF